MSLPTRLSTLIRHCSNVFKIAAGICCSATLMSALALGEAPPVTLEDRGEFAILANGLVTATIHKDSGSIRSLVYRDTEFVRQESRRNGAYFSMDGGAGFRVPSGCRFFVHSQDAQRIDIGMRQTWTTQLQAVDIEIHYVLGRGDSGLYTYALLEHPGEYPRTRVGEWRMVWKLPDDLLDTICVDPLRYRRMPTAEDFRRAEPTAIKEIVKITSGVRAGLFECKYDYNARYHETPFWGHADSRSGLGAWMVFGAHEWFNDGPTKQDLTSADRILHVHFGMNHYNGSGNSIGAGEHWRKIYGPFLLYLNHVDGGTDDSIRDVRRRLGRERAAWPYEWLGNQPEFPPAAGRGTVGGKFIVRDPAKPAVTGAGAWIGLSQPSPDGNWQFESNGYQYWSRVAGDGSFRIPHVRPGRYVLSAFVDGAVGEYERRDIDVRAGKPHDLGELVWDVPRDRGRILWEIGVPDRSAAEFRNGKDCFQGYLWRQFGSEWPNPLEFTIGISQPGRDWNFAHSGHPGKDGRLRPWRWNVRFALDGAPREDATLTLAIASADGARLDIHLNDGVRPVHTFTPSVQGGNALLREGNHAKYCLHRITLPAAALRAGNNTLSLTQTRIHGPGLHVMYDYLALEVP